MVEETILWLTWFWRLTFLIFLSAMEITTMPFNRKVVHKVRSCPLDEGEWKKASIRLNCNQDKSNTSYRYHCLPDSMLTMLVEFCYDDARPLIPEGNCVILDTLSTTIDGFNCTHFEYGCPAKYFDSDEIYKYPVCLQVDLHNNCFFAEKRCQLQKRQYHTRKMARESFQHKINNDTAQSKIISYYYYYYDSGKLSAVTIFICICATAIFVFVREYNRCQDVTINGIEFDNLGGKAVLCARVRKRYKIVNWCRVNRKSNKLEKIDLNQEKYKGSNENFLVINDVDNSDLTTYKASIGGKSDEITLKLEEINKDTFCKQRRGINE